MTLQPFEKWAVKFVGLIKPQEKTSARYIITVTEYLTRWVEAQPVKDCTVVIAAKFLLDNVLKRFGCPKILMSDRRTHFLNETISALTEEFQVYHQQSTPYHSQVNGMVEAFNKILENVLTKTPFQLVYCMEAIMPMEYIVPSFRIPALTDMSDFNALEEQLAQLGELKEE
eukprot:PITA_02928